MTQNLYFRQWRLESNTRKRDGVLGRLGHGRAAGTMTIGCRVTPGKKSVHFGLHGNIFGAQEPQTANQYATPQPR